MALGELVVKDPAADRWLAAADAKSLKIPPDAIEAKVVFSDLGRARQRVRALLLRPCQSLLAHDARQHVRACHLGAEVELVVWVFRKCAEKREHVTTGGIVFIAGRQHDGLSDSRGGV